MNVHCDTSIAAGTVWKDAIQFALHVKDWEPLWNVSDDPSHAGLSDEYAESENICVFDSLDGLVYGKPPQWAVDAVLPADKVDSGYSADGRSVPVTRSEDGLTVAMDNRAYLKLELVNAVGVPVKFLFEGSVPPGEKFIAVDWTGVDMNTTYLLLRVNGAIVSTKFLSKL